MKPCRNCQATIDEYTLDKKLEVLHGLTVDDFNLCVDCTTVVADTCVRYGGGVYVPRDETTVSDYYPACRTDLIRQTESDPGWACDVVST